MLTKPDLGPYDTSGISLAGLPGFPGMPEMSGQQPQMSGPQMSSSGSFQNEGFFPMNLETLLQGMRPEWQNNQGTYIGGGGLI